MSRTHYSTLLYSFDILGIFAVLAWISSTISAQQYSLANATACGVSISISLALNIISLIYLARLRSSHRAKD
jgi:hypothetical protein